MERKWDETKKKKKKKKMKKYTKIEVFSVSAMRTTSIISPDGIAMDG